MVMANATTRQTLNAARGRGMSSRPDWTDWITGNLVSHRLRQARRDNGEESRMMTGDGLLDPAIFHDDGPSAIGPASKALKFSASIDPVSSSWFFCIRSLT